MVFGLGWKVFLICLGFGVEIFRIVLKVLGFGGGFWVWGFEIWLRVRGLGSWVLLRVWVLGFVDVIQSFGSGVFGFCVVFGT